MHDLEQLIREHVLLNAPNPDGWETCVHTGGCDHGKRGPRAGFIFTTESISFNCFNCSVAAGISLDKNRSIPNKMRNVLLDFGISNKSLDVISFNLFLQNSSSGLRKSDNKKKNINTIIPEKLPLPKDFDLLEPATDHLYCDYLNSRNIDPNSYQFMVCRKSTCVETKKWEKRIIIPIFHNDDIVFYQGRDITGKSQLKYLNSSHKKLDRKKIISDYDILFDDYDSPLYVTEGWFDAKLLNGVAIFGNHIKDSQAAWLSRSSREKVYVLDRFGDGKEAAMEALELGWRVSIPYKSTLDSNIKDVSDLVEKYGRLFTKKLIQDNTYEDFNAKVSIEILTK